MNLKSFRIQKYRSIQDSGQVDLEGNLTCVVGKNQSGKTALLRALHKLNPHKPDPYDIRKDWPRGERRTRNAKQAVCRATFVLTAEEHSELGNLTSQQVTTTGVLITKDYEGTFEVDFPEQPGLFPSRLHPNKADELCQKNLSVPAPETGDQFRATAAQCTEEIREVVREGRYSELDRLATDHDQRLRAAFTPGNPASQHPHEDSFCTTYQQDISNIRSQAQQLPTMHREAHEYIIKHLPTFIYMDDYQTFRGTTQLDQMQQRINAKSTSSDDETFLMILKLSGLDLTDLIRKGNESDEKTKRERQYDLQDAAKTLTKDVASRWGQNPYQIEFRADAQTFFTEIEEADKTIGMIPLEEQSQGFQWFFSFDLRFMHDSEGTFEGCVLLLDEPGLHLHPGGQEDLLKRLDAYANKNTLIYTTHLPFLIDLREPARIRIMSEDAQKAAIVINDLGASGPDEKLTLQAALGMRLNQHYLVAQRNLVVEGVDDFWVISELSNLFARSGKSDLQHDVRITAAGGASEAVYMATFMVGQNLDVVALFDSDDEGRRHEERLRTKWLTRYKDRRAATCLLGDLVGATGDYAIEDLFEEHHYLKLFQVSHEDKLRQKGIAALTPAGTGPLSARLGRACEQAGILFNKGSIAKLLRQELRSMKGIHDLPQHTRTSAEKLLSALITCFRASH